MSGENQELKSTLCGCNDKLQEFESQKDMDSDHRFISYLGDVCRE